MKIEIFGTGCSKCQKTEQKVRDVLRQLGIDAEISHVDQLDEIVRRGVLATPAVAIDGVIKVTGRVPPDAMIRQWFGR